MFFVSYWVHLCLIWKYFLIWILDYLSFGNRTDRNLICKVISPSVKRSTYLRLPGFSATPLRFCCFIFTLCQVKSTNVYSVFEPKLLMNSFDNDFPPLKASWRQKRSRWRIPFISSHHIWLMRKLSLFFLITYARNPINIFGFYSVFLYVQNRLIPVPIFLSKIFFFVLSEILGWGISLISMIYSKMNSYIFPAFLWCLSVRVIWVFQTGHFI